MAIFKKLTYLFCCDLFNIVDKHPYIIATTQNVHHNKWSVDGNFTPHVPIWNACGWKKSSNKMNEKTNVKTDANWNIFIWKILMIFILFFTQPFNFSSLVFGGSCGLRMLNELTSMRMPACPYMISCKNPPAPVIKLLAPFGTPCTYSFHTKYGDLMYGTCVRLNIAADSGFLSLSKWPIACIDHVIAGPFARVKFAYKCKLLRRVAIGILPNCNG